MNENRKTHIPCVAVLMSTWNGEKYLQAQIDSILKQEGVQVKLIVRDDGSSDSTAAILEEYRQAGKLSWYTGKNLGYTASFMELCKNAPSADYYAFSDQDDIWLSEKLIHGIDRLREWCDVPAMAVSEWCMVDEELRPIDNAEQALPFCVSRVQIADSQQMQKAVCAMNHFTASGCLQIWNTALQQLLQGHAYPALPIGHDVIVGMLAILCGKYLPYEEKNILYRQHGANASGAHYGERERIERWKHGLKRLQKKAGPSISQCNTAILEIYRDIIPHDAQNILLKTICYQNSMSKKAALLFSDYPLILNLKDRMKFYLKVVLNRL